jgi:hypothetical protein
VQVVVNADNLSTERVRFLDDVSREFKLRVVRHANKIDSLLEVPFVFAGDTSGTQ